MKLCILYWFGIVLDQVNLKDTACKDPIICQMIVLKNRLSPNIWSNHTCKTYKAKLLGKKNIKLGTKL